MIDRSAPEVQAMWAMLTISVIVFLLQIAQWVAYSVKLEEREIVVRLLGHELRRMNIEDVERIELSDYFRAMAATNLTGFYGIAPIGTYVIVYIKANAERKFSFMLGSADELVKQCVKLNK